MYRKILTLGYRHVGDTLFTFPALCALKKTFPEAEISCVLGSAAASLLESHDAVEDVIVLSRNAFREKIEIRSKLKKEKFDAAVLFQHTYLNAFLVFALGIPVRAGLDWKGCGRLLTHKIPYDGAWHEAERYLRIVKLLGADGGKKYVLNITGQERDEAKKMLKGLNIGENDIVAGLFPGTSEKWKIKRWKEERFARLAAELYKTYGAKILVFGGKEDKPCVQQVVSGISSQVIDLCGKITLRQLAAVSSLCHVFISNDTGPMHVAAAAGANVIDICGQSNVQKTGPLGEHAIVLRKNLPCSPCRRLECDHRSCLELITVEDVMDAVKQTIDADRRQQTKDGRGK